MARQYVRPDEILLQLNDALAAQNPRGMFVTLLCMIVDPATGTVTCANAGHPPAVLLRPGSPPGLALENTGMVCGVMSGVEMTSESLQLQPGDTLVLYTDGVTEAFDAAGNIFEETGLLKCTEAAAAQPAERAVATVVDAVRRHAAGFPQSDDLTVVAVRRLPAADR
jgi:sigma-B regulation protein RsbU (phosphoserine phosphatase)